MAISSSWTPEQILALAPDTQVAQSARGLSRPTHWSLLGQQGRYLWGYCQGSGSTPYQVGVDLEGPAFRCTCPSRKRPCKHTLALLLLAHAVPGDVPPGEPPDWLKKWAAGLSAQPKARPTAAKQAVADPEARSRRAARRQERVQAGVEALTLWLHDLARRGLGAISGEPYAFWESQAARLVDAQAPGLARQVRAIGALAALGGGPDHVTGSATWPPRLLGHLARLHLLLESFSHLDALPPALQEEVRTQVGWTQDQDELRQQAGMSDRWLVLGQRFSQEDRLKVRRTWLLGLSTHRPALILDFAVNDQPFDIAFLPDSSLEAELVFWPGVLPLRALVKERGETGLLEPMPGYANATMAIAAYGAALAANPWLERLLLPLLRVIPVFQQDGWAARDEEGFYLPLDVTPAEGWRLLAISGGHPLTLAGEWDGERLYPLGAWPDLPNGPALDPTPVQPARTPARSTSAARWPELINAALLGTARASVPTWTTGESPLDALLGQVEPQPPERAILSAAALLSLWRNAGERPRHTSAPLPAPALPDERPACPPRAAQHLGEILSSMPELIEEWLLRLERRGYALPHSWLPELLDRARERDSLRALILPLLDTRGRWLAALHPEWQELLFFAEPNERSRCWSTGSRFARLVLLSSLRAVEPAGAREMLQSTWDSEPAADRAAFLACLSTGLGPDDEPFLEAALEDRSKEVRLAAAALLADLPTAALVQRMQARLDSLLHMKKGLLSQAHLEITVPDKCDLAMARDGIEEKAPSGLGKRAWLLLQMLASTPPSHWSASWQRTPEELIALAAKTEYEGVLLEGWGRAAARCADGAWAEALLQRWFSKPWQLPAGRAKSVVQQMDRLEAAVPQDRLEAWLGRLLEREQLEQATTVATLLQNHCRPWSVSFTRTVLQQVRPLAAKPLVAVGYWRSFLVNFALYAAPALAVEAERGWPEQSTWSKEVDRFVALLHFRNQMWEVL